jgi:hypothetical protein
VRRPLAAQCRLEAMVPREPSHLVGTLREAPLDPSHLAGICREQSHLAGTSEGRVRRLSALVAPGGKQGAFRFDSGGTGREGEVGGELPEERIAFQTELSSSRPETF